MVFSETEARDESMQPERAIQPAGEALPADEIDIIIAEFDGDERKAFAAALAELHRLEHELALSLAGCSFGFSRGWHHRRAQPCPDTGESRKPSPTSPPSAMT
jgi:hypothetical protein